MNVEYSKTLARVKAEIRIATAALEAARILANGDEARIQVMEDDSLIVVNNGA